MRYSTSYWVRLSAVYTETSAEAIVDAYVAKLLTLTLHCYSISNRSANHWRVYEKTCCIKISVKVGNYHKYYLRYSYLMEISLNDNVIFQLRSYFFIVKKVAP